MSETWTIQRMLSWMGQDFANLGIGSPRLDSELLLCRALGCDRVHLYMDITRPLVAAELAAVRELVKRRRAREPVAYILGEKEFYRRSLRVDRNVLVPRPETEILVDRALEILDPDAQRALDLCTGSGAIAITLAAERTGLHVTATDLSLEALEVARDNAARLGVSERVRFEQGDLFEAVPEAARFDLITANPPYVATADYDRLQPEITQHEPRLALVAGEEGMGVIRRICAGAPGHLEARGTLLIEVGQGQADCTMELMKESGLASAQAHRDLAGIERVVSATKPG